MEKASRSKTYTRRHPNRTVRNSGPRVYRKHVPGIRSSTYGDCRQRHWHGSCANFTRCDPYDPHIPPFGIKSY
jgi:hypothetical protein